MHLIKTWILRRLQFAGFGSASLMVLLLPLANLPARAQDVSGIVSGTVTDPSDSVVPGALVKLIQAGAKVGFQLGMKLRR